MNFGQLCNEFECISSPSIEATARQLARDILELREGNRALGTYAVSVKYKVPTFQFIDLQSPYICILVFSCFELVSITLSFQDPVRSFSGREKYKRPLWATVALENPRVVSVLVTRDLSKWFHEANTNCYLVSRSCWIAVWFHEVDPKLQYGPSCHGTMLQLSGPYCHFR